MTTPFLVCAVMTAISTFVSLGFSLAAVPGAAGQTRTLAFYTCSRSIAFAILSLVSFANVRVSWLEAVAAGMIIVQVGDAVIGVTIRNAIKTFGPAVTAIVNLAALIWLTNG